MRTHSEPFSLSASRRLSVFVGCVEHLVGFYGLPLMVISKGVTKIVAFTETGKVHFPPFNCLRVIVDYFNLLQPHRLDKAGEIGVAPQVENIEAVFNAFEKLSHDRGH